MKTLFLPLDERPCNAWFPKMLENDNLQLITPDSSILGDKKKPGDTAQIASFLKEHCRECDSAVIAVDTLLYGGLIPSRLHHTSAEVLLERLKTLKDIRNLNPKLKLYTFQCIMRCPSYTSGEEEPDYYEDYGLSIFRSEYLRDKKEREGLSEAEQAELESLKVPKEITEDYAGRRNINLAMNLQTLKLLMEGVIDFHVIPQDDSSPFGYTAIDQKKVLNYLHENHLETRTMVYPGADEVGMSLITRAWNEYQGRKPEIYPYYASVLGPTIIPLYEDRPMYESLKAHIMVTGAKLCRNAEDADYILAINCPGKVMMESFAKQKDVSYSSFRHLPTFVSMIEEDIEEGRKVIVCDSAFANGGDLELIRFLDEKGLLDRIYAYAGWNTNCNTLGTVLSVGQISDTIPVENIIYRIIEDVFYQADVRLKVIENDLVEMGLGYYDFKDRQDEVEQRIGAYLLERYNTLSISRKYPIAKIHVTMPWRRMFEIGMQIDWA